MATALPKGVSTQKGNVHVKPCPIRSCLALALMLAAPVASLAAATYTDSLKAADTAMGAGQNDFALSELGTALTQAANPGERALALAKKGYILAFVKQDFAGARAAVDEALSTPIAPVARVTALQVLAQCKMKADKDYAGAITDLQSALALTGVDWAKPALSLTLGDCYRESGQLDLALATYQSLIAMPNADAAGKAGAYLNSGFIYQYDRKDAGKAKEAYANAVQLRPDLKTEVAGHLSRLAP